MDRAAAEEGLDDFGDESFVGNLAVLTNSLRDEARLHVAGAGATEEDIVRLLRNRLRLERDLRRHPEISDEQLEPPVVIVGLPRTGTTKLQRMLATDETFQRLDTWKLLNPAPLTESLSGEADPRITFAEKAVEMLAVFAPEFMTAHPTVAREPDEEIFIMNMTFKSMFPLFQWRVPGYAEWLRRDDQESTYRTLHLLLQYLQWQDGGSRGRPWLLKCPAHLGHVDTMLRVFPDATFVHCHRHPVESIPSLANLITASWATRSARVEPFEVGAVVTDLWTEQLATNLEIRDRSGDYCPLDVHYTSILTDVEKVIDRIYTAADLALSQRARERFRSWEGTNPIDKHGRTKYSPEQFGATADEIGARFAAYIDRFALVPKT